MNLNRIYCFITVARHKSFSKAAQELYVTQPAVSDSVRSLEKELGTMLFHRVKQRVELTEEGSLYFEKVFPLLEGILQANGAIKESHSNIRTIHLGIPPMIGSFIFPQVFSLFENFSNNTKLELKESDSFTLLEELKTEKVDIAIVNGSTNPHQNSPTLSFLKIATTELMFCVSKQHALAQKESLSFDDISKERLILFKEGYIQQRIILNYFENAGVKPHVVLKTNQLFTVISFIRNQIGGSFLYSDIAKSFPDIHALSLSPKVELTLYLAWKASRTRYEDIGGLVTFFKENWL